MTAPVVRPVADPEELARAAAWELAGAAARAVAERGRFALALSGGSTPRRLYALLADPRGPFRAAVPWERTHVFFGDERAVPPDHPDSNFRTAREALLERVPVATVHRMRGEAPDLEAAAAEYEAELGAAFGLAPGREPPPALDLVLLGLGPDGHTASLFPGSPALEERRRWVVATSPAPAPPRVPRLTLTLPVLDGARAVIFLVGGADKANALARALAPGAGGELSPAARVRPRSPPIWIADRAALGHPARE